MRNKIIKLVAFCMATLLLIFLPGLFNLGFNIYLDITMKSTGKLPTVNTYEKLEKLIGKNRNTKAYRSPVIIDDVFESSNRKSVPISLSADSDSIGSLSTNGIKDYFSTSASSSSDYSSTNTQVIGVDEADILKNDGKYIYLIANNKLIIVEAFPAETMKKLSEVEIEKDYRAIDLYILGDKLFLVTDNYTKNSYYNSDVNTKINVLDITNRSNPTVVKTFEFTGAYSSSRKIGDRVYVFSNMGVKKSYGTYMLPKYRENDVSSFNEVSLSDVQYIPNDNYTSFSQIFVFDLAMPLNSPKIVTYLGEGANNVYMSYNNLYMAQSRWNKTTIYKFNLNNLYPRFEAKGTVDGSIINQFAMDEYNSNFRIATTKNNVSTVYVLSDSMYRLGSVGNIARGEQIKSVRFEGERGYVVTFRNTDPLFVIDLKNARAPKILGELKIPGYSTYLHPYDENHVIGFGYDGTEWGTNGKLKIALFDITDVSSPKEKFKETIDASTSELLTNHKSLLFSKEKDLIAFSVGKYRGNKVGKVYSISLSDGFTLRGDINHSTDVDRMLYMDDILYGVSSSNISAHDIKSLEELNRISI